jgi:hypothetical protein
MIRIGDVHCRHCGDEFEPDGYVDEDGAFCSVSCEEFSDDERSDRQAYDEARYGAARVF